MFIGHRQNNAGLDESFWKLSTFHIEKSHLSHNYLNNAHTDALGTLLFLLRGSFLPREMETKTQQQYFLFLNSTYGLKNMLLFYRLQ